jgi:hypothetical protein
VEIIVWQTVYQGRALVHLPLSNDGVNLQKINSIIDNRLHVLFFEIFLLLPSSLYSCTNPLYSSWSGLTILIGRIILPWNWPFSRRISYNKEKGQSDLPVISLVNLGFPTITFWLYLITWVGIVTSPMTNSNSHMK